MTYFKFEKKVWFFDNISIWHKMFLTFLSIKPQKKRMEWLMMYRVQPHRTRLVFKMKSRGDNQITHYLTDRLPLRFDRICHELPREQSSSANENKTCVLFKLIICLFYMEMFLNRFDFQRQRPFHIQPKVDCFYRILIVSQNTLQLLNIVPCTSIWSSRCKPNTEAGTSTTAKNTITLVPHRKTRGKNRLLIRTPFIKCIIKAHYEKGKGG